MKRGFFAVLTTLLIGFSFSSCEKCMICEINYTKTNGTRVTETSPQKCGYSGELDEKEKELRKAYSVYENLDINCNRER